MYIDYLDRIRKCDAQADQTKGFLERAQEALELYQAAETAARSLPHDAQKAKQAQIDAVTLLKAYIASQKELIEKLTYEKNRMRLEMYEEPLGEFEEPLEEEKDNG